MKRRMFERTVIRRDLNQYINDISVGLMEVYGELKNSGMDYAADSIRQIAATVHEMSADYNDIVFEFKQIDNLKSYLAGVCAKLQNEYEI